MWQTDVSPIWNSVMWLDKMNLLSPIGDNKFIENYSEWGNCCTHRWTHRPWNKYEWINNNEKMLVVIFLPFHSTFFPEICLHQNLAIFKWPAYVQNYLCETKSQVSDCFKSWLTSWYQPLVLTLVNLSQKVNGLHPSILTFLVNILWYFVLGAVWYITKTLQFNQNWNAKFSDWLDLTANCVIC